MDVGAGVIDADYRGNVGVVLFNHADEDYKGVCACEYIAVV
jgi:dUTPase